MGGMRKNIRKRQACAVRQQKREWAGGIEYDTELECGASEESQIEQVSV